MLTPNQSSVVAAMASGASVTEIADKHKISRQTIYTWRKTIPEFEAAVRQATLDFAQAIRDALNEHTIAAINTLAILMRDPETPPSIRVKIALAFLTRQNWNMPVPIEQDPIKRKTAEIIEQMESHLKAAQMQQNLMKLTALQASTDQPLDKTGHISADVKVSTARSAPCPCGSGIKYKRCCGHNAPPVLNAAA